MLSAPRSAATQAFECALQSLPNNWRWMVGSPLVPALLLGAAPWILPESPRWLVMRGELSAALAALHQVKYSQVWPLLQVPQNMPQGRRKGGGCPSLLVRAHRLCRHHTTL